MSLEFEKLIEDKRGKILFLKYNDKKINLVEIRKNFARGGHYHKTKSTHYLISGKIELWEKNINDKTQKISLISSPYIIEIQSNIAHLLIAKEDSLFFESFDNYEDTVFPEFRRVVEDLME